MKTHGPSQDEMFGLGWVGLDWIGLGWVRLGWVELDWIGLGLLVKRWRLLWRRHRHFPPASPDIPAKQKNNNDGCHER